MSEMEDYDVMVEQEQLVAGKKKTKKKTAVALCVAATYIPETNSIIIAAVCKDTKIPIPQKEEKPSKKEKKNAS